MLQAEEMGQAGDTVAIDSAAIFAAREAIQHVTVSEPVEKYLVDLVMATRQPQALSKELAQWISLGSSPRASIALHRASRAQAWLSGREHVLPEDVQAVAAQVLRHRLILSYDALADGVDSDDVITKLLALVAVG